MKATLMVGAPGAGKSTYVTQNKKLLALPIYNGDTLAKAGENAHFISNDDIRAEFQDPAWVEIWCRFEEEIVFASEKGKDVIIDGTHVGRKDREETVALLLSQGYTQVDAVIINTPLELCLERNSRRSNAVPDHMVKHMHRILERSLPHIHTEPFTKVTVIS